MKKKVLLLDIDGTIYDVPKSKKMFQNDLYKNLNIKKNILFPKIDQSFYEIREKTRYFDPSIFAEILSNKLNLNNKKEIKKAIWDIDKFNKCLYHDSKAFLSRIYKNLNILIFSTGDKTFQSLKLNSIKKYIKKNNIYIFTNKKLKLKRLISKLKNQVIFVIDDSPEVINLAKKYNKSIVAILIKRRICNTNYNYKKKNLADYKVKNLISAVKIVQSY
ncbi:MAG: hypothetical protein ABH812_00485 [bacterium]